MGLQVVFEGFWDLQSRTRIEQAVRARLQSGGGQDWRASVEELFACYAVRLETQLMERRKIFFERLPDLPDAIARWLDSVPQSEAMEGF
jgi:hypothetical protein